MNYKLAVIALFSISFSFAQSSTEELNSNNDLSESSQKSVVSGFYNRINVGVMGGSDVSPSFNMVNGIIINDHWSAGLGLGIESFFNRGYIPAFLEGNYNILKQRTSPWVSVMAGYEVPLRNLNGNKGGLTLGGKVGFSYFVGEHVGLTTSVGYRYAYMRDVSNWWGWDDFVTISHVNRFECRVGLVFK